MLDSWCSKSVPSAGSGQVDTDTFDPSTMLRTGDAQDRLTRIFLPQRAERTQRLDQKKLATKGIADYADLRGFGGFWLCGGWLLII